MSTNPIRGSQPAIQPLRAATTPMPQPQPAAAGAPVVRPRMAGDSAQLSSQATKELEPDTNEVQSDALDKGGLAVGVQTVVQGGARAAGQITQARGLLVAADLAEGNSGAVGKGIDKVGQGVKGLAEKLAPRYADDVARVTSPVIKGAGAFAKALGKAAPILSVLVAGYDTAKAVGENDPAKKNAAWANAGLSIGGTGLAIGALVLGATPVGWALGAGAAAVAAFQLVDSLAFGGKGTEWLGEKVAKPIAEGAKKVWNAITSL